MAVQELKPDYAMFLDKTTVLYGESGTGKSTLMKDILYMLQPHVHQIIVISPADAQNSSYSNIVPKPCIHYDVSEQHLNDIFERQMMLVNVCKLANDESILRGVYSMIPSGKRAMYDEAIRSVDKQLAELKENASDTTKAEAECKKFQVAIRKHAIGQHARLLYQLPLTENQRFAIEYMNVNPKMVIIFDDCTEKLNKMKQCEVLQSIFYRGRHAELTCIIGCHTDKTLDTAVKKNTFVTIFTASGAARAYFNRTSSDFDSGTKKKAVRAIENIFCDTAPNQKLVVVRGNSAFYKYTATSREDFRFGSNALWEFCDKVKSADGTLSVSNKFLHDFKR